MKQTVAISLLLSATMALSVNQQPILTQMDFEQEEEGTFAQSDAPDCKSKQKKVNHTCFGAKERLMNDQAADVYNRFMQCGEKEYNDPSFTGVDTLFWKEGDDD